MELPNIPNRLLSPATKSPTQSYFFAPTQRETISRTASPLEDLANSTYLTPSIASASCASTSDLWSGSNGSFESYHFTPPMTHRSYEKPPYRARSESADSLNMSRHQGNETMESTYARRSKRRQSKRKHRKRPGSLNQPEKSADSQNNSMKYFPGYEGDTVTPTGNGNLIGCNGGTDYPQGQRSAAEMNDDKKGKSSAQLMSVLADAVTTRRWSSVGIGDSLPKTVIQTGTDGMEKIIHSLNRSNTWNTFAGSEVINAVRARLTVREVSMDPPQNPKAITLRRASGVPGDCMRHLSAVAFVGNAESIALEPDQKFEHRHTYSAYLITTEDIDSITDIIQSRLAVRPKENESSGEYSRNDEQSASTITSLPIDYVLADAIATKDVTQKSETLQAFSGGRKRPALKQSKDEARKLSKAFARKSVPEVIWEDYPSPDSLSTCSHASSLRRSTSDAISKPNLEKPIEGDTIITNPEEISSPAASAEEFSRRISAQGETSPTSRVFKWVFKEPLAADKQVKDKPSDGDPREALAEWRLPKINPPAKTWKSLERYNTPTSDNPDVLSFPPLSGRPTMDWVSPLPEISTSASATQGNWQASCLYDAGIDARTSVHKKSVVSLPGLSTLLVPAHGPRHSLKSSRSNIESKRKSSVLLHPQAIPRTGQPFTIGNSLGVSSGARRKSSATSVRVKINVEGPDRHKPLKGRPWAKPRKDSGWPAHKDSSPEEMAIPKASAVSNPQSIRNRKEENKNVRRISERSRLMRGFAPYLRGADHVSAHSALISAEAETVVSEVLCQGHGCGASVFDSKTISTDLCG